MQKDESRTFEQVKKHYEIEKELASKLLNSNREDRQHLYTVLYDQLFKQVPHHPQLIRKADCKASAKEVDRKMRLIVKYLRDDSTFLEVGPGDCMLSLEVAKRVKKVYAVDVSQEITKNSILPQNFELIIYDGCTIPVTANTVTVAYSNQLMEHLHPEDAFDQLRSIYKLLAPGGVYICITPNRLTGPHDVSKYFDEVATGFHLKEYTHTDLSSLFASVGFSKMTAYIGGKGIYLRFPLFLIKGLEEFLCVMPSSLRKKLADTLLVKALLGVILVAKK
ncbi:SAM-dependent methyltransferase [Gloeocapsopsis sp. AAB1 = 1H9]|uniref:SAM-dependent methyltransferase n=2 Tax=Gloeocapsopsis TaxID=693222 RepID=A0A6N8G043_9CHRO|nr:SAM-dependent methyltransferase [Gloeocapsopsis dulcis AAB1 = 1H9]